MERLDNPSNFLGWASILVGGLFLSLSIYLLTDFPLSKEIESVHGIVEEAALKSRGKGSDTF
ncbi:hypothetical protein [Microbulbifer thermotolerans]|uniref:Uncharacterized protein n=1 Tax=Microbulbifer thermotolerans TaxID=252514 RepID=A0AB35I248_MICTH|nr:hypothetical protein [Microbulbifer thermotolerans]MCX2802460.1 hypothetical protein [Microbulbifer thermotolerans]MCX2832385.1 hypothetical protein [Microbulbifer thermotolerans]